MEKEKLGIQGIGSERETGHIVEASIESGGKESAERMEGLARMAVDNSGLPLARRPSAMIDLPMTTQV